MGDAAALRVPPHSVEAEQSVLGALLIDNRVFDRVGDRVQPASFYVHQHRAIFAAAASLIMANKPADVITVFDALKAAGKADEAGGLVYLNELAQSVPGASNAGRYADIVAQRAQCRQAICIARDLEAAAFEAAELPAAADEAVQALLALQQGQGDNNPRALVDLLPEWLDALQDRAQGG